MFQKFKKRHLISIFAIAIIVLIFFSGIGAATSGTVHNISGTSYSTIQNAINAAPDGDTIYVDSNTYKENIVVNVTGLILIGNDTGTGMPVVDAMGLGHAINITANGVTLDWFNATNATNSDMSGIFLTSNNCSILNITSNNNLYGICLESSKNNTLTNNIVNSSDGYGIYFVSSSDNILNNNTASMNSATGIFLKSSSNNNTLIGNIANNNTNLGRGIHLFSSKNNTLSYNIANNNTYPGIDLYNSINNNLTNNTANNNKDTGIYLDSSSNNTLIDNTANLNTNYGIYALSSSNSNILTSNNASLNDKRGIYLLSSINTLTNNIVNNNEYGIYLDFSNNNTLTNNTANGNTDTGIHINSSNDNNLNDNNVSINSATGIELYDSSNNTLTGNIVISSAGYGIYLHFSSNNTLTRNTANDNGNTGIYLGSSSNSTLTGNIANNNNNAGSGIELSSSSNSNITDNTAKFNSRSGIRLVSSSNSTLISNTANLNTEYGIYALSSSNNNTMIGNIANSNTIHGIYLTSSFNNTLYQNILYNNTNENAYDDDINNWNSSNLGNYYGDISIIDIAEPYGINDTFYSIGGTGNSIDNFPLIVASNAISPSTASDSSTLSFTVSTTLIDHASVGIENITLYYSIDNSTWNKYANSTTGTFTFTTSSSGTYYFRTVATDTYGMMESIPLIYDSKTTVSISTTTSPSGSSGGSRGGGSSGEEYGNIEVKDVVREYIYKGNEASYNFKEDNNAIDVIKFIALKNSGEIVAIVEVLKDTSSMVKTSPPGEVYQNMNIWVGKSGFATSSNIEDLRIGFKVKKSWIEENGIDESLIRLHRYSNDEWTSLSTSKKNEDDKYVYFEAKTPGFSPFAITVEETNDTKAVDMRIAETTNVFDTKPLTQTDVEPDTEEDEEETSGLPGFSIIMSILGIAGAILVRRK